MEEKVIIWEGKGYKKVPAMQLECGSICTIAESGEFCRFFRRACADEKLFPACSQEMVAYEEIE